MKMKLLLLFLLVSRLVFSQEIPPTVSIEEQLSRAGRMILEHPEYRVRDSVNRYFTSTLTSYLATEEGYDDPLSSVSNMLRLAAKDDFQLYTWQMPDSSFTYRQFGIVAAPTRKGIAVTVLDDQKDQLSEPEFRSLKSGQWFGAIYYQVIPVKKGRKTLYTLLGFIPGKEVNRKVIDVISVDRRGRPRFGDRIFRIDQFEDQTFRKPPLRLILAYSGDYSSSVRWNEKEKMIVMDHLVPPEPQLKGVYRMYGPDTSYDGLEWKKDWWHLRENIRFNTELNRPIVPPQRPTGLPPAGRKFQNKR